MSRIEEFLTALLNGETTKIKPRSRAEQYLKNCVEGCGCEGLPAPKSRLDALLYSLADKLSGSGGGGNTEADYEAGREAGKQEEYDRFWDMIQAHGTRTEYNEAFGKWDCEYIRPKYKDIQLSGYADAIFSSNHSLKKIEKEYFDFSKTPSMTTTANYTFFYCDKLLEIQDIGLPSMTSYIGTFQTDLELHTIEKLRCEEGTRWDNTFLNCYELVNIEIEGTIGQNGVNLQWSTKLSHDSLMSFINNLKDYSADTSGTEWIITFGSENLAKLTEDEKNIIYDKGWNVY